METVLANLLTAPGKLRAATLNGREYLVAPVTMVVPGILDGSEGPGLYTDEENAKSLDRWNGVPLVAYHPTDDTGAIASARDPSILDRSGMGWVFRTNNNGKLGSEAWFDVDWTKRVDARLVENGLDSSKQVLPRLQKGEPVEVSTGLKVTKVPAPEGSTLNGVGYKWVARDYEPDHLAVLPDIKGACSIDHGCGLLVNEMANESDEESKLLLWQQIGNLLGVNCGGPGGTKGPCPKGDKGAKGGDKKEGKQAKAKSGEGSEAASARVAAKSAEKIAKSVAAPKGQGIALGQKASEAASKSSKEANKKNTKESHEEAAKAHQEAAAEQDKAFDRMHQVVDEGHTGAGRGKQTERQKHRTAADAHKSAASAHAVAASVAPSKGTSSRTAGPRSKSSSKVGFTFPPDKPLKVGFWDRVKEFSGNQRLLREIVSRVFAGNFLQGFSRSSLQGDRRMALNRKSTIDYIVGNCDCWKDSKDVDILNGFSDNKLLKLREDIGNKLALKQFAANSLRAAGVNILNAEGGEGTDTEVAPGVSIADLAEYLGITADPGQDPAGYIKELLDSIDLVRKKIAGEATPPPPTAGEPNDVAAMDAGGTGDGTPKEAAGNRQRQQRKQSLSQWEADMPEAARDVWNRAKKVAANARRSIINQLLRHMPKDRKEAFAKKLAGKKTQELEDMLDLVGTREDARNEGGGRSSGRRATPPPDEDDDDGDEEGDDTSGDLYFPVGRQGRVAANDSGEMEELQPGPVMNWGQRNGTKS